MKVRLLKKLRKEANKEYFINTEVNSFDGSVGFVLYKHQCFPADYPCAVFCSFEKAQKK
jgi:hypothetical protein